MVAPSFDIILPTVCQPALTKAVLSVIAQKDPRWSLWVIADGIHYNSKIAELPFDRRIRYLYWPEKSKDHGATPRNIAIDFGKNEYIAYLNDGHTWTPHHLQWHRRLLEESDVIATCSNGVRRNGELGRYNTDMIASCISHTRESFSAINGWKDTAECAKVLWDDLMEAGARCGSHPKSTVRIPQ